MKRKEKLIILTNGYLAMDGFYLMKEEKGVGEIFG